ncbi:MAG: hypothetical protein ABI288_07765 [Ginsengibacter sp.]
MSIRFVLFTAFWIFFGNSAMGQGNGFLIKDGKQLFPIGWYSMPKDDVALKELSDAGFNIFSAHSKDDLDRLQATGIQGWMPLPLQNGVTEALIKQIQSVAGHPALALWEGPDEITLSFTQDYQYSLSDPSNPFSKTGKYNPNAQITPWRKRTTEMERYSREKSPQVMMNIKDGISYIRSVDPNNLQVWFNEGAHSAPKYVREYLSAIDITGCDYYPINGHRGIPPHDRAPSRDIGSIGYITEQWKEIGMGKPVYMVLQAFSWPEVGEKESSQAYPSFDESRYMAYDVITHGGRGIFYWGGWTIASNDFRKSLYALTSELNALQPFLTAPEQYQVSAYVLKDFQQPASQAAPKVALSAKQFGRDWMIAIVNDTDSILQNVAVKGLGKINGLKLVELYGNEEVIVNNQEVITRLKPREVKVFVTGKRWESGKWENGRKYRGIPAQVSLP